MLGFRKCVIRFLEEHPGYVCAECLALSVGAPLSPTTMITLGLHGVDGFATVDDVCSRCQRFSRVIKAESVRVSFLNGSEAPQFFVADLPTAGTSFTADKLQWKLRHEYGAGLVEYRGAAKASVP